MTIKEILSEVAVNAIGALVLINAAVHVDGVAPNALIVLVAMFIGYGTGFRVSRSA